MKAEGGVTKAGLAGCGRVDTFVHALAVQARLVPLLALLLPACTSPPAASAVSSSDLPGETGAAAEAQGGTGRRDGDHVPPIRLESITADRPVAVETGRNPFRFGAPGGPVEHERPVAPPPVDVDVAASGAPADAPRAAPGPTIPLKFIGIVEAPDSAGRVAVLSDAKGVYYGRQNDVIEGRYRIVRIGIESIEMELVDSGARQTIRLSGS